ncbi:hypothetical protein E4582_12585 [Luteimonas yindakuii]|uniref:Uncharacterized protein n=1 Tax=Luteimonas yindakuii TaxID=2565782 RepID=A0A4Z1RA50_9GAMM|nr:hypothetical protein [Luteimonas yindakuii]TKS53033.1 hypothetical protein E4582_12585 [Luteimonas yindakuii]
MKAHDPRVLDHAALERLQLLQWAALDASAKIDFFEEMVELAYLGGALAPERLAMRDGPPSRPAHQGRGATPPT